MVAAHWFSRIAFAVESLQTVRYDITNFPLNQIFTVFPPIEMKSPRFLRAIRGKLYNLVAGTSQKGGSI